MKRKVPLSMYISKRQKKKRKVTDPDMIKKIGRPRKLVPPLPNKDLDDTLSYIEDFSTEDCDTDIGEFAFNIHQPPPHCAEKNLAASNSPPSSPSMGSSSSEPSDPSSPSPSSPPSSPSTGPNSSEPPPSSSSDSDDEYDIWNSLFVRHCYAELRNCEMIRNLIENLYVAGCLPDFILLVTQLASGKLSPLNIAFLLCLERAKWQSLKSTTQMRFRNVTKKFWLVVYRLLKGKGLRFFSGPKNYGQVITGEAARGHYDPDKSEINFAVPDERYLCSQDRVLGRIIPPGIISSSANMLQNHKDVVLMADCKRLAKGLRGIRMGDMDLWGHERRPTLEEKLDLFRDDLRIVTAQIKSLPNAGVLRCHNDLRSTLKLLTIQVKDVREIENAERKRLLNYEKLNPDPNYKAAAKGACRAHIYDCKLFIANALELNKNICKCMSYLQKTNSSFNSIHVSLHTQRNVRRLLPANYVARNTTLEEHPELFKQQSPQWKKLRSGAHITASTAYSAMGFRGFKHVRNHFREFIYNKVPVPVDAATRARMQHGIQHEVRRCHNLIKMLRAK